MLCIYFCFFFCFFDFLTKVCKSHSKFTKVCKNSNVATYLRSTKYKVQIHIQSTNTRTKYKYTYYIEKNLYNYKIAYYLVSKTISQLFVRIVSKTDPKLRIQLLPIPLNMTKKNIIQLPKQHQIEQTTTG